MKITIPTATIITIQITTIIIAVVIVAVAVVLRMGSREQVPIIGQINCSLKKRLPRLAIHYYMYPEITEIPTIITTTIALLEGLSLLQVISYLIRFSSQFVFCNYSIPHDDLLFSILYE